MSATPREIVYRTLAFDDPPRAPRDLWESPIATEKYPREYADAQVAAGADTIGMSDAAASMIGPRYYREFFFRVSCACCRISNRGIRRC